MSSKIAILSLVSAVLAVPRNHGHQHLHKRQYGYGGDALFPAGNSTNLAGTGTGTGVAPVTTVALTTYVTDYSTVVDYVTLTRESAASTLAGAGGPGGDAPAAPATSAGDVCGAVVTSTYTNKVTVTVTAGQVDASSVVSPEQPASSGGYAEPVPSSVVAAEPTPISSIVAVEPTPTPTPEEPVETPELPTSIALTLSPEPSSAIVVVPEPSSVVEVTPEPSSAVEIPAPVTSVAAPTPTPSAVTPPSDGGYGTGKRGLAYNDASLCAPFAQSNSVSWAYNWAQTSQGLDPSFQYIPMLWGDKNEFASTWESNAKASIDAGVPYLLGMNEPDHAEQALMDTGVAAQFFRTHLTSLKSYNAGVQLGSPAVTNGGGQMGLTWLSNFMSACSDCQIDFCAIHWYDSADNIQYFKNHMTEAHEVCGGKPIWVTEFGVNGGSTDQVSAFLEEVMGWMDQQSWIERYSYFMVDNKATGIGNNILGTLYSTFDALLSKA